MSITPSAGEPRNINKSCRGGWRRAGGAGSSVETAGRNGSAAEQNTIEATTEGPHTLHAFSRFHLPLASLLPGARPPDCFCRSCARRGSREKRFAGEP